MTGEKIRFRFRKGGALRLISHLDTMRCFERMLRRAELPFQNTQGFHARPRLVFAQSLPLGVVGDCEVVELELTEPRDPDETRIQLNAVAPPGLELYEAKSISPKATAVARRVEYRVEVSSPANADTARGLLSQDKVWAERIKPRPRGLNIRPYLRDIRIDSDAVTFDLWVTGGGTARLDELIELMNLAETAGAQHRTRLDLRDETDIEPGEPPIDRPAETRPPQAVTVAARTATDETPAAPTWGLSPAGPVVE
jgi:radical SAM-linked protein